MNPDCSGWKLELGLCSNDIPVRIVTDHPIAANPAAYIPDTIDPVVVLLAVIICFLAAIGVGVLYGLLLLGRRV